MELYPTFIDAGYSPNLFWELSYGEIIDVIESYRRKQEKQANDYKDELKVKAVLNDVLSKQIILLLAAGLSGNTKDVPKLVDYFPMLFDEITSSNNTSSELALNKARMEEFAFWNNKKRKEGGES